MLPALAVVLYLQRVRQAFHGIVAVALPQGTYTVVFQYVKVAVALLLSGGCGIAVVGNTEE